MSLMREFRSFAMRGNVVDMAVGIIIGAAFGKIISSLVSAILMPAIGVFIGGMDFSNKVNKYLSMNINVFLINDPKIQARTQVKQTLALGVNFTLM